MKHTFTLLTLLFTLVCGSLSFAQEHPADQPAAKNEGWWKQRHKTLANNLKENRCDLLFIGDSITQEWETKGKAVWAQYFVPLNAANFGISGDCTNHVLFRMEDSKLETPHPPKVCVIMIGTNNTGHFKAKESPEETAKGILAIARKCTDTFPKTQVILLNIFPRGGQKDDALRMHNDKINAILNKSKIKNVTVANIGKAFLNPDGTFKPGMSNDLLHFSETGYRVWAEKMVPLLKKHFPEITSLDKKAKMEATRA